MSIAALGACLESCSSQPRASVMPAAEESDPASLAYAPTGVGGALPWTANKLWSRKLKGYISDLAISRGGGAVLAATLPNYESKDGAKESFLIYFSVDSEKKEVWRHEMSTQVRSLAISSDGMLAVAVTHDDKMIAFDAKGKERWETDAHCQPILLESRKEILCYHDDDAEPSAAFEIFDWSGNKKLAFAIQDDVLAMKVSHDENWVALALNHGQVLLLGRDYKLRWKAKIPEEAVDLDVSSAETPSEVKVAVVTSPSPQEIDFFDSSGKPIESQKLDRRVDQIGFLGGDLYAYGNGEGGQSLSRVTGVPRGWRKSYPRNSHYTPILVLSEGQAILSFEALEGGVRRSRVLSFSPASELLWRVDVGRELGAAEDSYLYVKSWSPSGRLAVAMDDGSFGVFQLTQTQKPSETPGSPEQKSR